MIRTFGTDIKEIQEEFNEFCEGKHHDYPEALYNGEKGTNDLRMQPQNIGTFYRNGKSENDIYLLKGTIEQPTSLEVNKEELLIKYKGHEIVQGYQAIYKDLLSNKNTMAMRDFYPWWNANSRTPSAGKLFLVDPKDTDLLQVFFDDNVCMEKEELGIIDVRNIDGNNIDFRSKIDLNLVMVQPLDSVFHENYFTERIDVCLENWRKSQ